MDMNAVAVCINLRGVLSSPVRWGHIQQPQPYYLNFDCFAKNLSQILNTSLDLELKEL